jgi:hypothetical protein
LVTGRLAAGFGNLHSGKVEDMIEVLAKGFEKVKEMLIG